MVSTTRIASPTGSAHDNSVRRLLIHSTLAAILADALMIFLHEGVHFLAGNALGYPSTLYAFGVTHAGTPTPWHTAIMAGPAPLFSLISGLVCLPFARTTRGGFTRLVLIWLAFISLMEGVCYLIITPFGAGDTADIAATLGRPDAASFALCAVELSAGEATVVAMASFATLCVAPMGFIFRRTWTTVAPIPPQLSPLPVAGLVATTAFIFFNVLISIIGLQL